MKAKNDRKASLIQSVLLSIALSMLTGQVFAHHSFGMFDRQKTMSIQGTVKTFEWKNPHAWLWISVPKQDGGEELWGLETAGPSMLNRMGITRNTFKVGDKVAIDLHPLADGRAGGEFVKATLANGEVIDVMERVKQFSSGG